MKKNSLLIFLSIFVCAYSFAQADVYTVKDVKVTSVSTNVEKAREVALNDAQKFAWKKLLKELAVSSSEKAENIPADDFVYFVRDYEIQNESFSARNYKATVTVRFQPSAVRDYFRLNQVAYTEKLSETSLVLPIYVIADSKLLWHENNAWMSAWAESGDIQSKLTPYVVPINDLADQHDVSLEEALAHRHNCLSKIAIRYGAQNVIVAMAMINVSDFEGPRIQVSLAKIGLNGDSDYADFVIQGFNGETPESLLKRSVEKSIQTIERDWKQENKVRFDDAGEIEARLQFESENDWNIVQRRLEAIPIIQKIDTLYLNAFESGLRLSYRGSPQNLKSTMPKFGLQLLGDETDWVIVRTENVSDFDVSDPRKDGAKSSKSGG